MKDFVGGWGASSERSRVWQRRRSNALVEVAAIQKVVHELPVASAASEAFLSAYEALRRQPASTVLHVVGSPSGLAWLRRVFLAIDVLKERAPPSTITDALNAGQSVQELLDELLAAFPVFALGAMRISGTSDDGRLHAIIERPTTIPGTALHVRPGPSRSAAVTSRSGEILVERGEVLTLVEAQGRGFRVVVDNRDALLGTGCADRSVMNTTDEMARVLGELFARAMDVLDHTVPGAVDEAALTYQVVAPSSLGGALAFPSSSNSTVLGMSVFSIPPTAEILAEMIVHEMSHNHLFALQDFDPLLDPKVHGEGWLPENLYSPWRDDPRPLNGIFHAVFVFTRVAVYWLAVIGKGESEALEDLAKRRLAALAIQLQIARYSIRKYASLTDAGERFFGALECALDDVLRQCASLGLENIQPSYTEVASLRDGRGSARERQREHLARFRQQHGAHASADVPDSMVTL